jgi:hypothetical protein
VLPLMFNSLLEGSQVDPRDVRILRHRDAAAQSGCKPYELWRDSYDAFIAHQSRQSARTAKIIGHAKFWASFVVTQREETLFVGLYEVCARQPAIFSASRAGGHEKAETIVYELQERGELSDSIAKLTIDWGGTLLPQVQRAETNDKPIAELRCELEEGESPGYLSFMKRLAEMRNLGASPNRGCETGRPEGLGRIVNRRGAGAALASGILVGTPASPPKMRRDVAAP